MCAVHLVRRHRTKFKKAPFTGFDKYLGYYDMICGHQCEPTLSASTMISDATRTHIGREGSRRRTVIATLSAVVPASDNFP